MENHSRWPSIRNAYCAQVPIKWEPVDVTPMLKDGRTVIPDEAIASVKKNFVALKGPLAVRHSLDTDGQAMY